MAALSPVYIVYQAYGNEAIMQECVFSLLSLSRLYTTQELSQTEIWIYTDNADYFKSFKSTLPLHFRSINNDVIHKWRGSINFVHRVKIEILIDFTAERKGNILYLDTDTCFLQPINKIATGVENNQLYMHVYEGMLKDESNAVFRKLNRFFKSNAVTVNKTKVNISGDAAMWNAGVLVFKTGNIPLKEILEFTDVVHQQYPKHIVEQFAFSLYLAANTKHIQTASPYILHYWNLKELRLILGSFFTCFRGKTWDELVYLSQLIEVPVYMQQKANFYENRSIMDKIKKQKWQPAIPDWNLALKELQ